MYYRVRVTQSMLYKQNSQNVKSFLRDPEALLAHCTKQLRAAVNYTESSWIHLLLPIPPSNEKLHPILSLKDKTKEPETYPPLFLQR